MNAATTGLFLAIFVACFVEAIEATTIVMAMGFTRSWRSAITGTVSALLVLAVITTALRYALTHWVSESALQLVIGTLLLIFGLQRLRKAILRSSGRKAIHDEDEIYREEVEAALAAGERRPGLDMFSFMVSFKGVLLEGMEVVFIVITFGFNANNVPVAILAAVTAVLVVLIIAVIAKRPLANIPENTLKYGVGILLSAFGTFWALEGIGVFRTGSESLEWPGKDLVLIPLIIGWFLLSRAFVSALRQDAAATTQPSAPPPAIGHPERAPQTSIVEGGS